MSEQASRPEGRVRRGRSDDLDAVVALYSAVAAEGLWLGGEMPIDWTPERLDSWRRTADDDGRGAWFLGHDPDGRLLGYLSVNRVGTEHAEFGMAVDAAARGQGVGGELLDATIAWCRAAQLSKLSCQVWPHNGAALALYRSRGMLVEGRLRRQWRRRNGQLWDALLLGLVLDEHSPGSDLPDADALLP